MRRFAGTTTTLYVLVSIALAGCQGPDPPEGGEVTVKDEAEAWPGYMVYSGVENSGAYLIDMDADVVHTWPDDPDNPNWGHVDLLDDTTLVAITGGFGGHEGSVMDMDWDNQVLQWLYHPAHHDMYRRENGNTVILGREYVINGDIFHATLTSDYFAEITPDDEVLWTWHTDEHATKLQQFVDVDFPVHDPDWAHVNTVEIIGPNAAGDVDDRFREGNLLFSYCALDTIGIVDMDSMAIVWAWGPGELEGQHAPTMLEDGRILIYDNGSTREWTRVFELDPLTEEIVWSYEATPRESFYSRIYGGAQRLPNGNTLITDSLVGRAFEVARDGELVWEWYGWETHEDEPMPFYRALRYPPELFEELL